MRASIEDRAQPSKTNRERSRRRPTEVLQGVAEPLLQCSRSPWRILLFSLATCPAYEVSSGRPQMSRCASGTVSATRENAVARP